MNKQPLTTIQAIRIFERCHLMTGETGIALEDVAAAYVMALAAMHEKLDAEARANSTEKKKAVAYLSGPISGNMAGYKAAFARAARAAEENGYTVLNPAVLPLGLRESDYMRISLAMLEAADVIIMLPGWVKSQGAMIEKAYAQRIGKQVKGMIPLYDLNIDGTEARVDAD